MSQVVSIAEKCKNIPVAHSCCVNAFSLQDLSPAENHKVMPYAEKNLLNYCSYQEANKKHVDYVAENEAHNRPAYLAAAQHYCITMDLQM